MHLAERTRTFQGTGPKQHLNRNSKKWLYQLTGEIKVGKCVCVPAELAHRIGAWASAWVHQEVADSYRLVLTSRTRHDCTALANLVEVTDVGIFHLPFKQKILRHLTLSRQSPAPQKLPGLRAAVILQGVLERNWQWYDRDKAMMQYQVHSGLTRIIHKLSAAMLP